LRNQSALNNPTHLSCNLIFSLLPAMLRCVSGDSRPDEQSENEGSQPCVNAITRRRAISRCVYDPAKSLSKQSQTRPTCVCGVATLSLQHIFALQPSDRRSIPGYHAWSIWRLPCFPCSASCNVCRLLVDDLDEVRMKSRFSVLSVSLSRRNAFRVYFESRWFHCSRFLPVTWDAVTLNKDMRRCNLVLWCKLARDRDTSRSVKSIEIRPRSPEFYIQV